MNKLSEEFDTLEELKVLEDAAKEHPFYNDFKEDLANAKAIIETVKKESTVAKTKNFLHVENKEYLEKFQMSNENIKSITNNGGSAMQVKLLLKCIVHGKFLKYILVRANNHTI